MSILGIHMVKWSVLGSHPRVTALPYPSPHPRCKNMGELSCTKILRFTWYIIQAEGLQCKDKTA
jgi:hypothetical protein